MRRYKYLIFLVLTALVVTGCVGPSPGYGSIEGYVIYEDSGIGVPNASIEIAGRYDYTQSNGFFRISNIRADVYTLYVSHPGIRDGGVSLRVTIPSYGTNNEIVRVPPRALPSTTGDVGGWVYVPKGSQAMGLDEIEPLLSNQATAPPEYEPLINANVTLGGFPSTKTSSSGRFYFTNVPAGSYGLTVSHSSLRFRIEKNVYVVANDVTWVGDYGTDYVVGGIGYYVVIGIDQYPGETRLAGPRDDALAVYNELFGRNKLAGLGRLLIRDGGAGTIAPTRANIEASIREAVTLAESSNDYLVIYFSGRTGQDFLRPSDDIRGEKWITDGQLEGWVRGFPGHVTLIIDGADSQSMADGIILPQAFRQNGYTVLASAKKGQEAWQDPYLGNGKLSVFTHFLVEGITTRRADTRSVYGDITAYELFKYTEAEMALYDQTHTRARQVPHLHEGMYGDTVIYRYNR